MESNASMDGPAATTSLAQALLEELEGENSGKFLRALRHRKQIPGDKTLTETLKAKLGLEQIVGESPVFITAIRQILSVAPLDVNILISGETGTGKELCARAIHYISPRTVKPFVPVNCGAIPTALVENELFGHERGAFTDASTTRHGVIREAEGGTLFLDEIDSVPLSAQVKLLRFLQERQYRPLGSTKTQQADVRVITATNVDLAEAVRAGKLRQDFYYRLSTIPLRLPPLRERRDDIPLLARHFLEKYTAEFNKQVTGLSPDAVRLLLLYEWPGNVREMEHVMQRAVALSQRPIIHESDLSLPLSRATLRHQSFREAKAKVVAQFERAYVQELLLAYQGNITKAAQASQKDRRAFWQLMRKHKIDPSHFRSEGS